MPDVTIFDTHRCTLGEGPLWHPERQALIWFDILGKQMFLRDGDTLKNWNFDFHVSAAGWLDGDHVLVAGETSLFKFDLRDGTQQTVVPLEADNPVTRSNDGRADPWGGFWIGTMGKKLEPEAGAIYRYYQGELRQIQPDWTIPNAICFGPNARYAYYTDTPKGIIWRHALEPEQGWPMGDPEIYLDLSDDTKYRPDGAVIDNDGNFWCAHYGHGVVTCHDMDGAELHRISAPALQPTCPAFGGTDLGTLFVTSAGDGTEAAEPAQGRVLAIDVAAHGQREHQVRLAP